MEHKDAISRRQFLAGLGVTAGALGLTVLSSACNKDEDKSFTAEAQLYPVYNGKEYLVKDFSSLTKNSNLGLSSEILENHLGLYKKYVEKVNQAEAMMANNLADEVSITNLAFSLNGMALHDIYFTNMTTEKTTMSQVLKKAVEESFGSFDNYYQNLTNIAMQVKGWSITGLNLLNHKIFNYGQDTHSSNFPNYVMPILALDVYDHAYVLDYGEEGKAEYINAWNKTIDWDLVSRRFSVVTNL